MSQICPCGSGLEVDKCCGPYIEGTANAPTAEALMRSRYSAYALQKISYLIDSLAAELHKDHDEDSVRRWAESAEWLGLTILKTEAGLEGDTTGVVEFAASFMDEGAPQTHRECARFRKDGDKWVYVDGDQIHEAPIRREGPKVGRNEPCPCNSGKKYKKCCGR